MSLFAGGCLAPVEEHDVVYDTRHDADKLDLYMPDDGAPTHPTVLFIHGGSWVAGDKDHFTNDGRRLASSGFVVASVNYRLLPDGQFPANALDCLCSLAFLRTHAAEYGIDPDLIAVMGYSAGAHLAGLVGLGAGNPELAPDCDAAGGAPIAPPAAVIPASGPQDMVKFWTDLKGDKSVVENIFGGTPDEKRHAYELGSPRYLVRPDAPPFLLMEDAFGIGGIEEMRDTLRDAGNEARFVQIDASLHILEQHVQPGEYEGGMASSTPEAWIALEDFLFDTIAKDRQ